MPTPPSEPDPDGPAAIPGFARALGLATAAALLLLGPALWGPDPIYGFDTVHEKLFWRGWAFGELRAGHLPLWCPHMLGGIPLISDPVVAFWSPPVALLHLLLPPAVALNATWFVHLVIAAVGTYALLVRRSGALAAAVGAVSYAFGAWMIGHIPLGGFPHLAVSAFTPWVFWAVLRILEREAAPGPADVALSAAIFAACILGGHLQFVYATVLMVAIYVIAALPPGGRGATGTRLRRLAALSGAALLALALVGVMLLPWLEFHASSRRATGLPAEFGFFGARLVPWQLIGLVAPTFFGDSIASPYWGFPTQGMVTPYPGMIALVLALAARSPRGRAREAWTLRAMALAGLVLAFGHATPLYGAFRSVVPFLDETRHPARWLHVTVLALAWLAALGFAALRERTASGAPARRELAIALVLAIGLGAAAFAVRAGGPEHGAWRAVFEARVDETTLPGKDPLRLRDPQALAAAHAISTRALGSAAALALLAAAALAAARRADPRLAATVPALLALDLLAYGHRYAATVPMARVEAPPAVVELLGPPDPELRVGTSVRGRDFPYPGAFARSHGGLNSVGQIWMHRMLVTGHGTPQGVFGTIPAAWRDLLIGPFAFDPGDERVEPGPVRDLVAGALWIDPAAEASETPGWSRAGEADGVVVSRRDAPLGRAWVARRCTGTESAADALRRLRDPAFEPAAEALAVGSCPPGLGPGEASGDARVVEDAGERIAVEVRVDGAAPALLVVSDNPLPGWSATVDEVPASIHRVNLAMRGLVVPPGEHRVEMRYRPRSFTIGAGLSASALALCVALFLAGRRRSAR